MRHLHLSLVLLVCILLSACQNTKEHNSSTDSIGTINSSLKGGLKGVSTIPIGGAISIRKVLADEKLKEITIQNFNSITATNDMKMYSIAREEGVMKWNVVDTLVAFCQEHKMRLFGHALVWHHAFPTWIEERTSENGNQWAEDFLKNYITEVVGRYRGKVAAWDVVNEAFENDGGKLRETFWYKTLGPEYIEKAFIYAHAADPDAELFYNDFNIERDPEKIDGVIELVSDFLKRDIPITGIGFQMHLKMDTDEEVIAQSLKKAADTGLKIHISELDIIFNKHNDSQGGGQELYKELTDEMKLAQADKYERIVKIYRAMVPPAQQYGITFWDFNDRDTWIRPFFNVMDWPTIFDENLDPKPAYHGFAKGLIDKP